MNRTRIESVEIFRYLDCW